MWELYYNLMRKERSLQGISRISGLAYDPVISIRLLATLDELVLGTRDEGRNLPFPSPPFPLPYGAKGTIATRSIVQRRKFY